MNKVLRRVNGLLIPSGYFLNGYLMNKVILWDVGLKPGPHLRALKNTEESLSTSRWRAALRSFSMGSKNRDLTDPMMGTPASPFEKGGLRGIFFTAFLFGYGNFHLAYCLPANFVQHPDFCAIILVN